MITPKQRLKKSIQHILQQQNTGLTNYSSSYDPSSENQQGLNNYQKQQIQRQRILNGDIKIDFDKDYIFDKLKDFENYFPQFNFSNICKNNKKFTDKTFHSLPSQNSVDSSKRGFFSRNNPSMNQSKANIDSPHLSKAILANKSEINLEMSTFSNRYQKESTLRKSQATINNNVNTTSKKNSSKNVNPDSFTDIHQFQTNQIQQKVNEIKKRPTAPIQSQDNLAKQQQPQQQTQSQQQISKQSRQSSPTKLNNDQLKPRQKVISTIIERSELKDSSQIHFSTNKPPELSQIQNQN